jgi:FkbM family methyltransferase
MQLNWPPFKIMSLSRYKRLKRESSELARLKQKYAFQSACLKSDNPNAISAINNSRSQVGQDVFAIWESNFKRNGYFVEFGATNGVDLSNTYMLEKHFSWTGILAEPAHRWHQDLRNNRTANIDTRCVWTETGQSLVFNEAMSAELSTWNAFSDDDVHARSRRGGRKYEVTTVSLTDLLKEHGAPREIDYLSIDTEGSELEILRHFNFDEFKISIITCEHNFTSAGSKIHDLLSSKGYPRKHEDWSQFDDWYVYVG